MRPTKAASHIVFCSLLNDVLTVSMGLANLHARVRKWSISIAKHNQCLTPACPVILDRPDDYWRTRASGQSATMLAYYSPMQSPTHPPLTTPLPCPHHQHIPLAVLHAWQASPPSPRLTQASTQRCPATIVGPAIALDRVGTNQKFRIACLSFRVPVMCHPMLAWCR